MSRPFIHCLLAGSLAATTLFAVGCGAPRSQQVRTEARGRYDRAGAQIAYDQSRQAFQSGQFEPAPAAVSVDRPGEKHCTSSPVARFSLEEGLACHVH